jgi:hypothetical protein
MILPVFPKGLVLYSLEYCIPQELNEKWLPGFPKVHSINPKSTTPVNPTQERLSRTLSSNLASMVKVEPKLLHK